MNLKDYISDVGIERFARKFKVSERAATAWKYGARRPRPDVAKRIVESSPVTWDGIYDLEPREPKSRAESRAAL